MSPCHPRIFTGNSPQSAYGVPSLRGCVAVVQLQAFACLDLRHNTRFDPCGSPSAACFARLAVACCNGAGPACFWRVHPVPAARFAVAAKRMKLPTKFFSNVAASLHRYHDSITGRVDFPVFIADQRTLASDIRVTCTDYRVTPEVRRDADLMSTLLNEEIFMANCHLRSSYGPEGNTELKSVATGTGSSSWISANGHSAAQGRAGNLGRCRLSQSRLGSRTLPTTK